MLRFEHLILRVEYFHANSFCGLEYPKLLSYVDTTKQFYKHIAFLEELQNNLVANWNLHKYDFSPLLSKTLEFHYLRWDVTVNMKLWNNSYF